ncbi:MAG: AI-2E family transporter [Candidatus Komeilibacteria bacterium]|nr:AI-2E family transporter [Candidatus Komeilibacteria bacterium]
MSENFKTINISTRTFMKVLVFILALAFVYLIREAIVLIFVALILAAALDPSVAWLKKFGIPKGLGILVVYIVVFGLIAAAVTLIIPPITTELKLIANDFPVYYDKVIDAFSSFTGPVTDNGTIDRILDDLSLSAGGALDTVMGVFGGIVSFFLVLVITFYFTVEEEGVKRFMKSIVPAKYLPYLTQLVTRIQRRLGFWLRGQLILSLIIFVLTFIGLTILGVEYALILALIAGLFEIIPYLGPILGAIPAIFLAFAQSPLKALLVFILYVIIQQSENHIITPKVMGKAVGINPLLVIIALVIGGKLGGFVGLIMAVPVVTALSVFLEDFWDKRLKDVE